MREMNTGLSEERLVTGLGSDLMCVCVWGGGLLQLGCHTLGRGRKSTLMNPRLRS